MDIHQARTEASQEEIIEKMEAWREGNKACLQKMEACLERQEPSTVEMVKMMTDPETGVCPLLTDR
jgi:hypothetical protein